MRKSLKIGLLIVTLAAVLAILLVLRVVPSSAHTDEEFGIETYISSEDADGDGMDDAQDIVASARAYLNTNPQYGSAYYEGGYPDDGRGVCTDVVAQALLGAGYDLRQLVDDDIHKAPNAYALNEADPNIDFRRVRNLRVFFNRCAQSLTTDVSDISQWQGGDIVCWGEHIGIVSDKRNRHGHPFVLHNGSAMQVRYEEDVLNTPYWGPITNHWRWR